MVQKTQQINWAGYAQIAYVNFGWSPDEFWRATPSDFWCAYRGWQKILGKSVGQNSLSRAELNALVSGDKTL
ncbi:MAG: phage tail assembly chaperone [Emcibacter sp.]|nr:phage tail assembly chaperone [Emcibacter sp.]